MVFFTTLTLYLVAKFATTQRPIFLVSTGMALGLVFLAKETGFVIAADHVADDRTDARIGLSVIASAFMVGGIAATLLINHRSWKSPWLLAGLLPGIVGIWWTVL